uniref:Uncharacterized protein n=1 Tax=Meloidogyne enterolobii TaxID=390850 RepID=A0A6V7XIA0_MELEN|nr:unnamed protein product [Meloidogyne enterolobii]
MYYICFDQPNKNQKIINQNTILNNELNRQNDSSNLVLGLGGRTFERFVFMRVLNCIL